MKKSIILIVCSLSFYSCGLLIQDCRDSEKTFKKSFSYNNQIPLTVKEFKSLIYNDTTHYKMVFLYSPCCYGGSDYLPNLIKKFEQYYDSTKIKLYFVASGTGDVKYNVKFLSRYGFGPKLLFFLRDTANAFTFDLHGYRIDLQRALNYVFPDTVNPLTFAGTPETLIISKKNKLKRFIYKHIDKNGVETTGTSAYYLEALKTIDFDKIDFDVIENQSIAVEAE